MGLSQEQKEVLDKFKIPLAIKSMLATKLNETGGAKAANTVDFFGALSDELQIAENQLQRKRFELKEAIKTPDRISKVESEIKESWQLATALWRTADYTIQHPEIYQVRLDSAQIERAIQNHNAPIVELIKWQKQDFFDVHPSAFFQWMGWMGGMIGGALLGLIGGPIGGIRQAYLENFATENSKSFAILLAPWYAIIGIFSGCAMGAALGARTGFEMGSSAQGCKLGFLGAYLNPFHDRPGSQNQLAVELEISKALFLSNKARIKSHG